MKTEQDMVKGTFLRINSIPKPWLEKLTWREKIKNLADQLYEK